MFAVFQPFLFKRMLSCVAGNAKQSKFVGAVIIVMAMNNC